RFDPATRAGRLLLAHELAHVVQQSAAAPLASRDGYGASPSSIGTSTTAWRLQRFPADSPTGTASPAPLPLFCGSFEDWVRHVLGIEPGPISDFSTCFCLGANVADMTPVIGVHPAVEAADCFCNVWSTLQLAFNLAAEGGCID